MTLPDVSVSLPVREVLYRAVEVAHDRGYHTAVLADLRTALDEVAAPPPPVAPGVFEWDE